MIAWGTIRPSATEQNTDNTELSANLTTEEERTDGQ